MDPGPVAQWSAHHAYTVGVASSNLAGTTLAGGARSAVVLVPVIFDELKIDRRLEPTSVAARAIGVTPRSGLALLVVGLAACAAPPPVRTAPRRPALLTSDEPLPPYGGHRPAVAALDGRGLLGLWSVEPRTGELAPLARRPIADDAGWLQLGQHHQPSVQEAVAQVGTASIDAPRRLTVGLRLLRDGLGVEVGDRDTRQLVRYLLRVERWQLEVTEVTSGSLTPSSAPWPTTALVATTTGVAARPLQVEALLSGATLEPWRTHELSPEWDPPALAAPPDRESCDLAATSGAAGTAPDRVFVAVVVGEPPRLLVYQHAPPGWLSLCAARAVGPDLARAPGAPRAGPPRARRPARWDPDFPDPPPATADPRAYPGVPLVAALDARGQLGLWAAVGPDELEPIAKRAIERDALFSQFGLDHDPTITAVRNLVGAAALDRPRRLAVAVEPGPRGLTVRVGDLGSSRAATYLLTDGRRRSDRLELTDVAATTTVATTAEVGTRALTAGAAGHAAQAEADLTASPPQFWSRSGEGSSNGPTDLPFGIEPRGPPGLQGADLAVARGADGSAHVAVVVGAPPRLLVYRWTSGRGFALRVVRGVGADLELERVP